MARLQLLHVCSKRCCDEGVTGLGADELRHERYKLGEFTDFREAGVGGLGGSAGGFRPAVCNVLGLCECPGHAAPGRGAALVVRIARAAEIALKLAEPRIRGVGGLLSHEEDVA